MTRVTTRWALAVLVCFVAAWPLSGAGTTARPEEVGLSSERLQQVNALVKRHLDKLWIWKQACDGGINDPVSVHVELTFFH